MLSTYIDAFDFFRCPCLFTEETNARRRWRSRRSRLWRWFLESYLQKNLSRFRQFRKIKNANSSNIFKKFVNSRFVSTYQTYSSYQWLNEFYNQGVTIFNACLSIFSYYNYNTLLLHIIIIIPYYYIL